MAKFALLIGVSEYKNKKLGLTSLPSAVKDVEAFQEILQNEQLGGFDSVIPMINQEDIQKIQEEIYKLFTEKEPDDVLLFYFTGHGVTDQKMSLFLTTPISAKDESGKIKPHTTIQASSLHNLMNSSRSKRQVIILDCCFSGAFPQGLKAKDAGEVNIEQALGGRGRVILTSSSSVEKSFEQNDSGHSIYTYHLVEGIKTGDAGCDDDGWILAENLHEYVSAKVQVACPDMTPKIYPFEEGYKIRIAKSPKVVQTQSSAGELGIVLVGDVVNLSDMRGVDQRKTITKLWEFLKKDQFLNDENKPAIYEVFLNRVLIAITRIDYQEILKLTVKLLKWMNDINPPAQMRIGVHPGQFELLQANDQKTHIIGTGINTCTRITEMGDANHIIISEEFVTYWKAVDGEKVYRSLFPDNPESPIEFFSQQEKPHRIHLYCPSTNSKAKIKVPKRLALLDIAQKQLNSRILPQIEFAFLELLQEKNRSLTWSKVKPRVSILVPDPNNETTLTSTEFRYLRKPDLGQQVNHLRKGSTIYLLEGKGQGPAGQAFNSDPPSPQVLFSLPSFKQSKKKYIQRLEEWDVPPQVVESFNRHARTFIAFPFMLSERERPEGVICIDTLSELGSKSLSESDLLEIAKILMDSYGLLIAALWRLRV